MSNTSAEQQFADHITVTHHRQHVVREGAKMVISFPLSGNAIISIEKNDGSTHLSCSINDKTIWAVKTQSELWNINERTLKSWANSISIGGGSTFPKAECILDELKKIFDEIHSRYQNHDTGIVHTLCPEKIVSDAIIQATKSVRIDQNLDETEWEIVFEANGRSVPVKFKGDQLLKPDTFGKKWFNIFLQRIYFEKKTEWETIVDTWRSMAVITDVNPLQERKEDSVLDAIVNYVSKVRFGFNRELVLHENYGWYDEGQNILYVRSSEIEKVIGACSVKVSRTSLATAFKRSEYFGGLPARISVNGRQIRVWRFNQNAIKPVIDEAFDPESNDDLDSIEVSVE